MRSPGVYRRQRHMPGRWFSTTTGGFLEYESLLERDWMLLMDFDREVDWICEQPLRLRCSKNGRSASHVPDLLVWRGSEAPDLCDVKSSDRLENPEFQAQVCAMEAACAEPGGRASRAVTNARLLASALLRRTAIASWAAIASTIGGAENRLGNNDRAYRAALKRTPALAAELDRLVRTVEDWETAAPIAPTVLHSERMSDNAMSIKAYAAELFAPLDTADLALRASMLACRAHTDLTWADIAAIHDVPAAHPTFSQATVTRRRRNNPAIDLLYQQLLDQGPRASKSSRLRQREPRAGPDKQTGH